MSLVIQTLKVKVGDNVIKFPEMMRTPTVTLQECNGDGSGYLRATNITTNSLVVRYTSENLNRNSTKVVMILI